MGKTNYAKKAWIKQVGTYSYYSLILGGFNPVVADGIFDNRADVIAMAFISKMAYEHIEIKK